MLQLSIRFGFGQREAGGQRERSEVKAFGSPFLPAWPQPQQLPLLQLQALLALGTPSLPADPAGLGGKHFLMLLVWELLASVGSVCWAHPFIHLSACWNPSQD